MWITVSGRSALNDIGDEGICIPGKIDCGEHFVEEFARLPHKRVSATVFVGTRAFPHNKHQRVFDAFPRNGKITRFSKRTAAAGRNLRGD